MMCLRSSCGRSRSRAGRDLSQEAEGGETETETKTERVFSIGGKWEGVRDPPEQHGGGGGGAYRVDHRNVFKIATVLASYVLVLGRSPCSTSGIPPSARVWLSPAGRRREEKARVAKVFASFRDDVAREKGTHPPIHIHFHVLPIPTPSTSGRCSTSLY